MERKIYAIVMAAGRGTRFGSELPKQFVDLAGKPVVVYSIEALRSWHPDIDIVLALNPDDLPIWGEISMRFDLDRVSVTPGGSTRWESVRNAIDTLCPGPEDVVMVHDGARPLVTPVILDNLIRGLEGSVGAIPVVPLTDSIRLLTGGGHSRAVDRSEYRAVQTPQAFSGQALKSAYQLPYRPDFTDDASVMAAAGYADLDLVEGDYRNIKITNPMDLVVAEIYLKTSGDE